MAEQRDAPPAAAGAAPADHALREDAVDDAPAPFVGQFFPSFDAAFAYVSAYCQAKGHHCRLGRVRNVGDRDEAGASEPAARYIACKCEGKPKPTKGKGDSKSIRTQCKFTVSLYNRGASWEVKHMVLAHNHPPLSAPVVAALKFRGRPPPEDVRQLVLTLDDVGLSAPQTYAVFSRVFGEEARQWTEEDVRTILAREGRDRASDAARLFAALKQLSDEDPAFFLSFETDPHMRVRRLMFMSPTNRANYVRFGDVVFLDASLTSNRFRMPLVTFSGVNDDGLACVFGVAILPSDGQEDLAWACATLRHGGYDTAPSVVYTGTGASLQAAVASEFPAAKHLLSPFMLPMDASRRLGALLGVEGTAALSAALENARKLDAALQFDEALAAIAADPRFREASVFVSELQAVKASPPSGAAEKWANCHVRDVPMAGLRSKRRQEALHQLVRTHATAATPLREFLAALDLTYAKDGFVGQSGASRQQPHASGAGLTMGGVGEHAGRPTLSAFVSSRTGRELVQSVAYAVQATDQKMPVPGVLPSPNVPAVGASFADPRHVFGLHVGAPAPPLDAFYAYGGVVTGEEEPICDVAAKASGGCRDASAAMFVHALMQSSATAALVSRGAADAVERMLSGPVPVGCLRTFRVWLARPIPSRAAVQEFDPPWKADWKAAEAAGRTVSFVRVGPGALDYVKRCSCRTPTHKGYPCRHIFAVEAHVKAAAGVDMRLVAERWLRRPLCQVTKAIGAACLRPPAAPRSVAAAAEDVPVATWQQRTRAIIMARASMLAWHVGQFGGEAEAGVVLRRLEQIEKYVDGVASDAVVDESDEESQVDYDDGDDVRTGRRRSALGQRGRPAKRVRVSNVQ